MKKTIATMEQEQGIIAKKDANGKVVGYQAVAYLGYVNGKQQRKRKTFSKKGDAREWKSKMEIEYKNQDLTPLNNNILFRDFMWDWFNFNTVNKTPNTIANVESRIKKHIIPNLGEYKVKEINSFILQNFYNNYLLKNLSINYAKKIMDIINTTLKYAKNIRIIKQVPTITKVKNTKPVFSVWEINPKKGRNDPKHFLTATKDTYIYLPILLELNTGLRIAELCGLRWMDLDSKNNLLTVNNQIINLKLGEGTDIPKVYQEHIVKRYGNLILSDKLKTEKSKRIISIPQKLTSYLLEVKQKRNAITTDFIVVGQDLEKWYLPCDPNNLRASFKRAQIKLREEDIKNNIEPLPQLRFHDLRHTHATLLLTNNTNIKAISKRLGHDGITETLNTYTHVLDIMENHITETLSNIL